MIVLLPPYSLLTFPVLPLAPFRSFLRCSNQCCQIKTLPCEAWANGSSVLGVLSGSFHISTSQPFCFLRTAYPLLSVTFHFQAGILNEAKWKLGMGENGGNSPGRFYYLCDVMDYVVLKAPLVSLKWVLYF